MPEIPRALGVAFIEAKMVDSCTITRDVRGVDDAVLNEATGELESSIEDTAIYSGNCLLTMINTGDKEFLNAEGKFDYNVYKVLLPKNSTTEAIRIGDTFTLTTSVYLSDASGKTYRVRHIESTTHQVYKRILVERKTDAIGTPTI